VKTEGDKDDRIMGWPIEDGGEAGVGGREAFSETERPRRKRAAERGRQRNLQAPPRLRPSDRAAARRPEGLRRGLGPRAQPRRLDGVVWRRAGSTVPTSKLVG